MAETKYGKYIITQPKPNVPPKEWGSGDIGTDRVTRMVYLDEEYPEGAYYLECLWLWKKSPEDHIHTPHTHDFDEMLGFFGTDTDNPTDLCGEIEIWLEDEKHLLKKSCVVFIPKGLKHCPLIYRRIDRPIFHFSTAPSSSYGGDKE